MGKRNAEHLQLRKFIIKQNTTVCFVKGRVVLNFWDNFVKTKTKKWAWLDPNQTTVGQSLCKTFGLIYNLNNGHIKSSKLQVNTLKFNKFRLLFFFIYCHNTPEA